MVIKKFTDWTQKDTDFQLSASEAKENNTFICWATMSAKNGYTSLNPKVMLRFAT